MSTALVQPMMSPSPLRRWLLLAAVVGWMLTAAPPSLAQESQAQPATPPLEVEVEAATTPEVPPPVEAPSDAEPEWLDQDRDQDRDRTHGHSVILRFSQDTNLPAHETVDSVISIVGSSTTAGRVREAVVSVFGDTHVSGPVGDAAIAIFGNVFVDSPVRGDVVAVFGNVELGPEARVGGQVVVVSGELIRNPAATIHGDVQQVTLPAEFGRFEWLRPWVKHCLLLGRPLALEPGLGWAWTLALGFLTFYIVMTLMFSSSVEKCVRTIETQPGRTVLASILTLLLTPILTVLLAITVIGVALIPFMWIGLFIASLFGKAVILAALGRRVTRLIGSGPLSDIAFAVLVGGAFVLALYIVPVLGFIAAKVLGILGLGVVIYTLLLAAQARRERAFAAGRAASAAPIDPAPSAQPAATEPAPAAATPFSPEPAAAIATAGDSALPRAGFWIRMLALLIDAILIGVAFSVLWSNDVFLPALAVYGAVMWKLRGTTIGGILCNLKVVRVDGREVDWSTAIVRALGCFLSLAVAGPGIPVDRVRQRQAGLARQDRWHRRRSRAAGSIAGVM